MTMVIKADDRNAVKYAISVLKQGGIIIYPTESSYGIGADALNIKAVKRIFRIKGRSRGKHVPVIVGNARTASKYYHVDSRAKKLIRKFIPGPLTLIPENKYPAPLKKILGGFRIPSHPFALTLAKKFKKPVTATSANISGEKPLYRIKDVIRTFGTSVDLIIDSGNLPQRKPSTIYDVARKKVLRRGPVSGKEIKNAFK